MMPKKPHKQVHVDVPIDLHTRITNICPEHGQISILTRKLYRAFLVYVKEGDPDAIAAAGKAVAETWDKEL
jgi:hypothetical protein